MSDKDMFLSDDYNFADVKFQAIESTFLKEGDYVAEVLDVEPTFAEDLAKRFVEKTRQLLVTFDVNGKTVRKWYNLVAYKRYDSKELLGNIDTISKSKSLLKSIGFKDSKSFNELTLEEKMEACFDSVKADAKDPEGKVFYAIFKGNGKRLLDKDRTDVALGSLGRAFVFAGIAKDKESLRGEDAMKLIGCTVGIRVSKNNFNQTKVDVISVDDVSDLDM